ncbi:DUF1704 domain-containing protein [Candidatus Parcubacteria bacterium]|nr:DUF1704 domain-containing protein [Candidatus Parcubacteria bacterium]
MFDIDFVIKNIKDAEREIKNKKIDPSLKKKFIFYAKEIYEIGKDFEMIYSYFEPNDKNNRSFKNELERYLENKEKGIDYQIDIEYPKLEEINIQYLEKKINELEIIKNKAKKENRQIKNIIIDTVLAYQSKIGILVELKKENNKKAFEYAKKAYGDVDEDLYNEALQYYKKRILFLEERKKRGFADHIVKKIIKREKFDAQDIKKYFDLALKKSSLNKFGFKTIIDSNVTSIDVRYNSAGYNFPVIFIPRERRAGKRKIFQLIAHEIGCHSLANIGNKELGIDGLSVGRDWEIVHEGMALVNEEIIKEIIMGDSFPEFEIRLGVYYILAMQKAKEMIRKKKKGDIKIVYNYIFGLHQKEMLAMGYNKKISKEKAREFTKKILIRIYRGLFPYYFPKDKTYFEGMTIALKMKKNKVDIYPLISKVDPKLIPDLIKIGFYKDSEILQKKAIKIKIIAEQMWENE